MYASVFCLRPLTKSSYSSLPEPHSFVLFPTANLLYKSTPLMASLKKASVTPFVLHSWWAWHLPHTIVCITVWLSVLSCLLIRFILIDTTFLLLYTHWIRNGCTMQIMQKIIFVLHIDFFTFTKLFYRLFCQTDNANI